MMEVVLDDVPDNPLARDQAISSLKGPVEVGGCSACTLYLLACHDDLTLDGKHQAIVIDVWL